MWEEIVVTDWLKYPKTTDDVENALSKIKEVIGG